MSPSQIDPSWVTTGKPLDPVLTIENLRHAKPDINFIRFQWVDYSGVLRAKVLVIEECLALLAGGSFLHAPPIAFHCSVDGSLLPGANLDGVHWMIPDWSSVKQSSSLGTATVMCGVTSTMVGSAALNNDLCPRQALVKVLREATKTWELEFLIGFEVEFQVMKLSGRKQQKEGEHEDEEDCLGSYVPYSRGLGRYTVSGLRDPCWTYVEEAVKRLRAFGVHITAIHAEGMRGQYEIALGPLPPLQAVDQLVLVHSTLKDIFNRRGCTVTMSPRPVPTGPFSEQMNGQHMHLSLQPVRPDQEEFFLGGMLRRLPSLWGFFLSQESSYQRVAPLKAGALVGWGSENRSVPIRKINAAHWEIRSIDATANMYLTLAAVLGAGLLGLAEKEPLVWPDMSTVDDTAFEKAPLPASLRDSLSVLAGDFGGLDTMLGKAMVQQYVDLKQYELEQVENMGSEKARNLLVELF
ncbi:putative glutamine synthetase [Aspergillus undulatus]|uniref:putative glutamine synthetase n=1 Tax=Aspergillus undulatus TaxID=1810928 RepID=UPI003CCE3AF9